MGGVRCCCIGAGTRVGIVGDPSGGRALVMVNPVKTAGAARAGGGPGSVLIGV